MSKSCIVEARKEGFSIVEIANKCREDLYTVYRVLLENGDPKVREEWDRLEEDVKCVLWQRYRLASIRRTAEICKVSVGRVRSILKKYGDPFATGYWEEAAMDEDYIDY